MWQCGNVAMSPCRHVAMSRLSRARREYPCSVWPVVCVQLYDSDHFASNPEQAQHGYQEAGPDWVTPDSQTAQSRVGRW
jgi:hypothetical protein